MMEIAWFGAGMVSGALLVVGSLLVLWERSRKADEDAAFDKGWEAAKRDYGYYDKIEAVEHSHDSGDGYWRHSFSKIADCPVCGAKP